MQSRSKAGASTAKGPWPAPCVEAVEAAVEKYVLAYPDYGHRRIHALALADGHATSPSTVLRAMRRLRQCPGEAAVHGFAARRVEQGVR